MQGPWSVLGPPSAAKVMRGGDDERLMSRPANLPHTRKGREK
ncbi:MAG: hypothetical protein ACFFGP_15670 [Promethearchaeota archaeon]